MIARIIKQPYRSCQRGAIAIEFVVLFPLFLAMLYAIISYSLIMASQQALHSLSSEAARAVVAVNRGDEDIDVEEVFKSIIQERVDDAWISGWVGVCDGEEKYFDYTPGGSGERDQISLCFRVTIGPGKSLALPRLPLVVGKIPSENLTEVVSSAHVRL